MPMIKVAYLVVPVIDLARSERFYDVLAEREPSRRTYGPDIPALVVSLPNGPDLILRRRDDPTRNLFRTVFAVDVTSGLELARQLMEVGGTIEVDIQPTPTMKVIAMRDPDGNIAELCEHAASTLALPDSLR